MLPSATRPIMRSSAPASSTAKAKPEPARHAPPDHAVARAGAGPGEGEPRAPPPRRVVERELAALAGGRVERLVAQGFPRLEELAVADPRLDECGQVGDRERADRRRALL